MLGEAGSVGSSRTTNPPGDTHNEEYTLGKFRWDIYDKAGKVGAGEVYWRCLISGVEETNLTHDHDSLGRHPKMGRRDTMIKDKRCLAIPSDGDGMQRHIHHLPPRSSAAAAQRR